MSFATGMQMGFQHQRDVADRALQAEREKRAQEVHALQVAEMQRQARLGAETDSAYKDFEGAYGATGAPAPAPGALAPAGIPMSRAPRADNPGAAFLSGPGAPAGTAPAEPAGIPMSRAPEAPPPTDVGGMPGPAPKASDPFAARRSQISARKNLAMRTRDMRGLQALEQEDRSLQRDEAMSKIPTLIQDEGFRDKLNGFINKQSSYVTISPGTKDPKTGRMMFEASVVQPNGKEKRVPLSESQYMQLAQGQVLMEMGHAEEGMKAFQAANKDVAEGLDRQGRNETAAGKFNADQQDSIGQERHRQATLGEQSRHNRATEGNDAARTAAAVGKQVSPATLEKLRVLEVAYIQAQGDPAKQQQLRQQYEILSANAAAEVGKPRGLPERGGPMNQQQQIEARAKLKAAGYPDEQIEAMVTGYDPIAKIAELLQARKAGAAGAPGAAPQPAGPATGPGLPPQGEPSAPRQMSDGSGRFIDPRTGRTLPPEAAAVLQKMARGEPTSPRERALLQP